MASIWSERRAAWSAITLAQARVAGAREPSPTDLERILLPQAGRPLDPSRRARLDEVVAGLDSDRSVLLDVRTPEEYRGELFMLAPPTGGERSGHIPGAIPLYYEQALNEDGTFRSVEELRSLYQQAGVSSDKNVITYCAVGMRAGHTWLVLSELLGHAQVANYDRSWNEWGRQPDTPIERDAPGTGT